MGKNVKIQTKESFKLLDTKYPIYKSRNGLKLIKINNIFYNIYDTNTITKIKNQIVIDNNYEKDYIFI
tara:strand:+ start:252 stop:455 length:204 start_codon:yes stop_codon:yes gene_type:complete